MRCWQMGELKPIQLRMRFAFSRLFNCRPGAGRGPSLDTDAAEPNLDPACAGETYLRVSRKDTTKAEIERQTHQRLLSANPFVTFDMLETNPPDTGQPHHPGGVEDRHLLGFLRCVDGGRVRQIRVGGVGGELDGASNAALIGVPPRRRCSFTSSMHCGRNA